MVILVLNASRERLPRPPPIVRPDHSHITLAEWGGVIALPLATRSSSMVAAGMTDDRSRFAIGTAAIGTAMFGSGDGGAIGFFHYPRGGESFTKIGGFQEPSL